MNVGLDRRRILHLVVINAFVGGMVGIERTVLPLVAEVDFGVASRAATLAFIATFGITKATRSPRFNPASRRSHAAKARLAASTSA